MSSGEGKTEGVRCWEMLWNAVQGCRNVAYVTFYNSFSHKVANFNRGKKKQIAKESASICARKDISAWRKQALGPEQKPETALHADASPSRSVLLETEPRVSTN